MALIGASTANDAGYTGSGVKVAVVDTGIDTSHTEFSSKGFGGASFGAGSSYSHLADGDGHGTHVASIIAANRGGSGMRGVAYDASLYSYRIADDSGSISLTDSQWASLVDRHTSVGIQVSNNSWGSSSIEIDEVSSSDITSSYGDTVTSFQNAVSGGTIFVWAAGNNGDLQPSWQAGMPYRISNIEDGWLAVMSVDLNLQETDYTQRCGLAKDWCVAAPGGGAAADESAGIYAAQANGSYVRLSGTSMAAPHVTGLVATVFERFPSLSSSSIRNRILTTATYAGLKDTSGNYATSLSSSSRESIFGQGLVTYSAATSVIGNLNYVIGEDYFSAQNSFDLSEGKLELPSIFANNTSIMNDSFTVFDSFDGANFELKGHQIFKSNYSIESNKLTKTNFRILDQDYGMGLNFISIGSSSLELNSGNFWGDRSQFFSESDSLIKKDMLNLNFSILDYNNIKFNSFIASKQQNDDFNFDDIGIQFTIINDDISFISGFSQSKYQLNTSVFNNQINKNKQNNFEIGAIYKFTPKLEFFYRNYTTSLSEIIPTPLNFGLQDAELNTKTIGSTYSSNDNTIIGFGFYQPQQLVSGTISYLKPVGRHPDGTIYYESINYKTQNHSNFPMFLTINKKLHDDMNINLNLKQSYIDESQISYGEIVFLKQF